MEKYGIILDILNSDGIKEIVIYTFNNKELREEYIKDKFEILQKCNPAIVSILLPNIDNNGKIECSCVGDRCKLKGLDINKVKIKHIDHKKSI